MMLLCHEPQAGPQFPRNDDQKHEDTDNADSDNDASDVKINKTNDNDDDRSVGAGLDAVSQHK